MDKLELSHATSTIEQGAGCEIQMRMNAMPFEESLHTMQRIVEQNKINRTQQNSKLIPQIEIVSGSSQHPEGAAANLEDPNEYSVKGTPDPLASDKAFGNLVVEQKQESNPSKRESWKILLSDSVDLKTGSRSTSCANTNAMDNKTLPLSHGDSSISDYHSGVFNGRVVLNESIGDAPGAKAHNIKDVIESTDGLIVSPNKFKLTDYAKHDSPNYSHMVTALEDRAYQASDSWLPEQETGPNATIATQNVAKLFRDAAVMRLGYMNHLLTSQDGYSSAPSSQDLNSMTMYMQGSVLGSQADGVHANRNVKSTIEMAYKLNPGNPDMKVIVEEYNFMAKRISAFNQTYIDTHGGETPSMNEMVKPLGIAEPTNAN